MSTKTHRIASIPGDGIGIEVVAAAIEVLKTVAKKKLRVEYHQFSLGNGLLQGDRLIPPL